jgi:2-alkyl-3-oxoalkanoate reductase
VTALVTGGGGFLGGHVVRQLRERSDDVRSLSRNHHEGIDAEQFQGDLADADAVLRAADGCDVVFHIAAKAGVWGPREDYHRVNVVGTENVIAACRAHGIQRLVYTSTPSVVYGDSGIEGGDESLPYPDSFLTPYPETKAIAERAVLAANDDTLSTVALRPHLVIGPGDNHLVPRIVERGRAGLLRRIGSDPNPVDWTWVEDCARVHLAAADRLGPGAACAGKAYFVSQGEPVPIWDLINRILAAADAPPVEKTVPAGLAYFAGACAETVFRVLGRKEEPRLTRFVAKQLSTPHWFDISAAKRDLGYAPQVTLDDAMERLRAWLQEAAT